jgi:CheY-like chemotaxis protein
MIRVLVVDDDADNRRALSTVLAGNGFDVATASDAGRALLLADLAPPHVVLVGYHLASGGARLVRALRERRGGDVFVAVLHDGCGPFIENECRRAGADLVLATPRGDDLCRMISVAAMHTAAAS